MYDYDKGGVSQYVIRGRK